jgi:predicted transcriptional regulator
MKHTFQHSRVEIMRSATFTAPVDATAKKRLGRQFTGIKQAISSLDRGEGVPHAQVKDWIASWGSASEQPTPKRS